MIKPKSYENVYTSVRCEIIVYMKLRLRFICAYTILLRGQLHYWCLQSLSGCRVQGTQHCSKLTVNMLLYLVALCLVLLLLWKRYMVRDKGFKIV